MAAAAFLRPTDWAAWGPQPGVDGEAHPARHRVGLVEASGAYGFIVHTGSIAALAGFAVHAA